MKNKCQKIKKEIEEYFSEYEYKIIDIKKCIKYLTENYYIRNFQDVLQANIEAYNITCPIDFLDEKYIVRNDDDYIKIGNKYLNRYMLEECDGFEELINNKIIKKQ